MASLHASCPPQALAAICQVFLYSKNTVSICIQEYGRHHFRAKDQGPNFFVHQQQRVPEDMTHFMNGLWSYLRTKTFIFLFAKSQEKQKKLQSWGDTASSLKTFPQSHTALLWVWTLIRKRIELKLEWFAYKLWSTNCCYSSWRFAFVCLHLFYRKLKGKPSSRI